MNEFERQIREPRIAALRATTNAAMFEELQHLRTLNVELFDALARLEKICSHSYYEPDATEEYKAAMEQARNVLTKVRGE